MFTDSGLIITEGRQGILSLHIGGPANLETYIFNKYTAALNEALLYPGVTKIRDYGSIYCRENFDAFGLVKINRGVKCPKVTLGFYI